MSFALRIGEPPVNGVHRILLEHIGAALNSLKNPGHLTDDAIHEVRKKLKGARASLRLLRPYLGRRRYRQENHALRDAAQSFRAVRDAKVQLETLQELTQRIDKKIPMEFVAALRRTFARQREEARRAVTPSVVTRCRQTLQASRQRVQTWSARKADPAWLSQGIKRVYKNGRRNLSEARRDAGDEQLHELRKQAKYFGYELAILQTLKPESIGALAKLASKLGKRLGDDHDLAVMQQAIRQFDPMRQAPGSKTFSKFLRQRRKRLQAKAWRAAKRLYSNKPRSLARQFKMIAAQKI